MSASTKSKVLSSTGHSVTLSCTIILQILTFFVFGIHEGWTMKSDTTDILDNLFQNNRYDNKVRPGYPNGTLNIAVSMYILPWFDFEESRMEYSTTIILIQRWKDERLSFGLSESERQIMLNGEYRKAIWTPDTYIKTEKRSRLNDMTIPNEFIIIRSDGEISLESKTFVTVGCSYTTSDNSEKFPFDSHKCILTLASFKSPSEGLRYHWHSDSDSDGSAGVEMHEETTCNGFHVKKLREYQEVTSAYEIGTTEMEKIYTPTLSLEIEFKRSHGPYISNVYIPLFIFAMISITSLGLVNARVGSFLNFFNIAFVNIFMALRFNAADMIWTENATALDKYLHICNLFIIGCAIVNVTVIYLENTKHNVQESIELKDRNPSLTTQEEDPFHLHPGEGSERANLYHSHIESALVKKIRSWIKKIPEIVSVFCEFSSWTFTGAFLTVNAFYWGKYL